MRFVQSFLIGLLAAVALPLLVHAAAPRGQRQTLYLGAFLLVVYPFIRPRKEEQ